MRINPYLFGVLVLALFLGTIFGFQSAGVWSTSGKITSDGKPVQPSSADVNTIKGWMTLEQVSSAFGIPVDDILAAFDLPADTPASTPLKELETDTFSVVELRNWISSR